MRSKMRHLFIPDTQCKKGVPMNHLTACGNYIVDKQPEVIIHAGDHWDMPSLSAYDPVGCLKIEGARYKDDVDAGAEGMETLLRPIWDFNNKQKKWKMKQYRPRLVFLYGNHEERILRAINKDPKFLGKIALDDLEVEKYGWESHPFLQAVDIDSILYSHYFINTSSLKKGILGGTIDNRLKSIGQSFSMGHQQQCAYGMRYLNNGQRLQGLVAGAFYQHEEEYMGPQGNHHWRGMVMKHEVKDGSYDPMFLSMDYLLEEYL